MKRLSVLFLLACLASGAWQFNRELTLSRIGQITDLTIDEQGGLWILSPSAIAKIDSENGNQVIAKQTQSGRALTVSSDNIYYIDSSNRLVAQAVDERGTGIVSNLTFSNASQMAALSFNKATTLVILEPAAISFATPAGIMSTLNTNAERFAFLPHGDYSSRSTAFYTLSGNRIYVWTGGNFQNSGDYSSRLIHSASYGIIDFCVDGNNNLYVLFTDSITVIDQDGKLTGKIGIGSISRGSRIMANPVDNGLLVFDQVTRNIQFISEIGPEAQELIILNKNRPNPVDNFTEISFTINEPLYLTITIYNLIGEPVKQIARDRYLKGTHRVIWRADDAAGNLVPNGVYFYRLESDRGIAIKQLIVLR
ncbi:T9SS type A sorting domain-containing protein [candidate division WOR-3 bacterium]|nr:T9SS type A sorting domain-containing protein [candidate division WOR-3 bacterium]